MSREWKYDRRMEICQENGNMSREWDYGLSALKYTTIIIIKWARRVRQYTPPIVPHLSILTSSLASCTAQPHPILDVNTPINSESFSNTFPSSRSFCNESCLTIWPK